MEKSLKESVDEKDKVSQGMKLVEEFKADCSPVQILSGSSQKYLMLFSEPLEE
jgi:hypothetical protein